MSIFKPCDDAGSAPQTCEQRGWRGRRFLVGLLVGALLAAIVNESSLAAEPAAPCAACACPERG